MINKIFNKLLVFVLIFIYGLVPLLASAHEVYVLDSDEIKHALALPPLNLLDVIISNGHQFIIALIIGILAVVIVLGVSISRKLESKLNPTLFKLKSFARVVIQITLGLSILASAYFGSMFGTELDIAKVFGSCHVFINILLYVSGFSILFGILPRIGSLLMMSIYIATFIYAEGMYALSYLIYFGEALFVFLCGGYGLFKSNVIKLPSFIQSLEKKKYFILRIALSLSVMYAAVYAKFIHGELALSVVTKYNLTNYFPFDPLFVVLGAFLIEMTVALFYLLGFELRLASILFLIVLSVTLVFFGESIWPHIILIGTALGMLLHGYDEYSIERHWYKKGESEPVL